VLTTQTEQRRFAHDRRVIEHDGFAQTGRCFMTRAILHDPLPDPVGARLTQFRVARCQR
jgi:hypothetical protein